jgi:hypothetical protein
LARLVAWPVQEPEQRLVPARPASQLELALPVLQAVRLERQALER